MPIPSDVSGTIVHIGAGRGSDLELLLSTGAQAILLVEPQAEFAEKLVQLGTLDPRIRVISAAVGSGSGTGILDGYSFSDMHCLQEFFHPSNYAPGLQKTTSARIDVVALGELLNGVATTSGNWLILDAPTAELHILKLIGEHSVEPFFANITACTIPRVQEIGLSPDARHIADLFQRAGYRIFASEGDRDRWFYSAELDSRIKVLVDKSVALRAELTDVREEAVSNARRLQELGTIGSETERLNYVSDSILSEKVEMCADFDRFVQLSLEQQFESKDGKYVDKWSSYLPFYAKTFGEIKFKTKRLLEIGIQNGGSLDIWDCFFPNLTHLVGVDVDEKCRQLEYKSSIISVVIGPAESQNTRAKIKEVSRSFDLIIDDGSHVASHVVKNFLNYFPVLEFGGTYVVEDAHTSYWTEFGGGLSKSESQMNFFKTICDIVNYEHWSSLQSIAKHLEAHLPAGTCLPSGFVEHLTFIQEVTFANSIVRIRKGQQASHLGHRIVKGTEALVDPPVKQSGRVHGALAGDMGFGNV